MVATLDPSEITLHTPNMLQVTLGPTPYRTLSLKLAFPPSYPHVPLAAELKVPEVPLSIHPDLVQKLLAAIENLCRGSLGREQIQPCIDLVRSFVAQSRLAPCYEDIKSIIALGLEVCAKKDKAGTFEVLMSSGEYEVRLHVNVPANYPGERPELTLQQHNLPERLAEGAVRYAQDLAVRLAEPPMLQDDDDDFNRDVTDSNNGGRKGKQNVAGAVQAHASDKKARSLAASFHETKEKARQERRARVENFVPRRSIFPAIESIWADLVLPITTVPCPVCAKRILPAKSSLMDKIPKDMRAERSTLCPHLYHFHCLETYVTNPPFDKGCKVCGEKIKHRKLVTESKALEARWAAQKAREREIADAADLF